MGKILSKIVRIVQVIRLGFKETRLDSKIISPNNDIFLGLPMDYPFGRLRNKYDVALGGLVLVLLLINSIISSDSNVSK